MGVIEYCRLNEDDKKYKRKIELQMNYDEMKQRFMKDDV